MSLSSVSHFRPCNFPLFARDATPHGLGVGWRLKGPTKKSDRLQFVVNAEFSKPLSVDIDDVLSNSKTNQSRDLSKLPWIGPVPGDIAEVEAYCRIFRAAERLHIAIMDALCNPLTGECSVSYDFTSEEKPLLEDKIVSVLGCMVSLLNKGKEDVLSGRSSNCFRISDMGILEDELPPLAIFRTEMKRCCESLHIALEKYLTPDDDRSWDLWTKLQRLKNVCYDSGFSRDDGHPCHTLFANWNPVYLSPSKHDSEPKESEVAFWSGGHVTEEGLKWLLEQGFKTIIDLRAENTKDIFYEAALKDAVLSGRIELVKLPVEAKNVPSMKQVEEFASLVLNSSKKPIYLHSKEGSWRTSAMVSRWRQYMTLCALHPDSNKKISSSKPLSQDINVNGELFKSSIAKEASTIQDRTDSPLETSTRTGGCDGLSYAQVLTTDSKDLSSNGNYDSLPSNKNIVSLRIDSENEARSSMRSWREIQPLKAQLPPSDVFSRKEMAKFFRSKISPNTFFNYLHKRVEMLPVARDESIMIVQGHKIVGNDYMSRNSLTGSSNDPLHGARPPLNNQSLVKDKKLQDGDNSDTSVTMVNAFHTEDCHSVTDDNNNINGVNNRLGKITASKIGSEDQKSDVEGSVCSVDDNLGLIGGSMCASTTGVVRVQSRKKAEMFLVRTDGFSCTREKVTESSLAFSHPSTQQQMLMWKSTPKTVLLLKKLGPELMEEAKEVASFLYHQEKMNVLVEPDVHDIFARIPGFGFVQTFYIQDTCNLHERVDFVACLGGDGVILHASNIFRGAVPPVVSFNLGSLGFLTSHTFEDFRQDLRQVIHGNKTLDGVYITLRMRLQCEIFRNGKPMPGKIFDVLNEVVVDRGSNPYLSKIECYEHDRLITKVQADGVIVATPTGSTAYSTAAGGSMVHPNVPCMLFTPICPHSLSFRPVILPDSARLELKIPEDARSNAWASFDGKRRQQLLRGDSIRISMSQHPLPTVNKFDQTGDWFHSLISCLNWNERLDQKAL